MKTLAQIVFLFCISPFLALGFALGVAFSAILVGVGISADAISILKDKGRE